MLHRCWHLTLIVSCILLTAHVSVQAQADDKQVFTKLIGAHTLAFAHYQVKSIADMPSVQQLVKGFPGGPEEADKQIQKLTSVKLNEIDTATLYMDQFSIAGPDRQQPPPPYFLVRTTVPVDRAALATSLGRDYKTLSFGKHELLIGRDYGLSILDDKTLFYMFFGSGRAKETAQQQLVPYFAMLETSNDIPYGLKKSVDLAMARKHHCIMAFTIKKEMSQFGEEAFKNAPAPLAPFKPLIKTRSGYMTMDYQENATNDFRTQIKLNFDDAASAKAGQGAVKFGLAMGKIALSSSMPKNVDADTKKMIQLVNKQLDAIKSEVVESDVLLTYDANISEYMPLLVAAIVKVRRAADTMLSASNMRQMMIAMHNYHNDYNAMPPAVTMKDGKPLHSWRVLILPYMEQDALFKQLKLNEPWNSEHNLKVFESAPMPKFLHHPAHKDESSKKTYYKVFSSKPGARPSAGFQPGGKITLGQLTVQDGTSNTAAMIEAGPPVLWYQPDDIVFDPNSDLPKLESPWPDNRVQVAFFDASVRGCWLGQHEDIWKALITRNGGENVDIGKLEEKQK